MIRIIMICFIHQLKLVLIIRYLKFNFASVILIIIDRHPKLKLQSFDLEIPIDWSQ